MPMDSKGGFRMKMPTRGAESIGGEKSGKGHEDIGGDGDKSSNTGHEVHEITDHKDGTYSSHMGGEEVEHPDHMHLMAHIGHHLTGGDKHHITHHDGMSHKTHGIHESGEHEETHDHENLESVKQGLDQFFNEEGQEGHEQEEHEPQIGGGY